MSNIHIEKDTTFIDTLQDQLDYDRSLAPLDLFKLTYQSEHTTLSKDFTGLRVLEFLPDIEFSPHQINAATEAIEHMNGRAILADEVGLGKTIEAGLILKEYMLRGLVKKALILVPASLVNQWVQELNDKFYIPAIAYRKNYAWDQCDIVVSSIDTAKKSPHKDDIAKLTYDFVLVDEAHKLKNHKTLNYSFVQSIKKKYCLLLTATPIQNRLIEIFNLISILKPGHLGSYDTFKKEYANDKAIQTDKYLKKLIQKVMIRHTRKDTDLNQVKRHIHTVWLEFSEEEKHVYQSLENMSSTLKPLIKLTLLRELCSSREACYLSLENILADQHAKQIENIRAAIAQLPHHVKAQKIVELINQIGDEKVIIFTEYRATQYYLQWYLQEHGISSVPFRGGFKSGKKDWMRQLFRDHAQVLIATEAGGEGINLQFCNHLINYDLPWNPMRVEQRIGRIHRFGQNQDVQIYNLAIRDTIEEHIMSLLYEKIHLFEHVVGKLDDILSFLEIQDIEKEIKDIFTHSDSDGESRLKLSHLSEVINQAGQQFEAEG